MQVVLVDLSAKYIHSGLAVKYLMNACIKSHPNISVIEETINRPIEKIVEIIYRENPQIVGFSCYIWNIETILRVTKTLKKLLPSLIIILGGPEVSYTPHDILNNNAEIDYVICGEGEIAFPKLLNALKNNTEESITGVYCKTNQSFELADYYQDLNQIPYPYQNLSKEDLANKIVYYECSRGCPYRCSYCLSGLAGKVRFLDINRVKEDLYDLAINKQVKQVKFVDRTFNHNKEYAYQIFDYLKNLDCNTNFHFEVRADIFNQETLELLSQAPKGRFQFEIGIQSTNPKTLKAINRPHDWQKIVSNVAKIRSFENIHQHLDLIAALPYEDIFSFENSFNQVFALKPDMLQLGFLKLLKGSSIWHQRFAYNYLAPAYTPYEVLSSDWLKYDDILKLKSVEHVLELFYNSNYFTYTLDYLIEESQSFQFFRKLGEYFQVNQLDMRNHSLHNLFEIFFNFLKQYYQDKLTPIKEVLKLDYLLHFMHRKLPEFLNHNEIDNYRQTATMLLKREEIKNLLSDELKNKNEREILKKAHLELFGCDPLLLTQEKVYQPIPTLVLFDYSQKDTNFFSNKAVFHKIDKHLD